MQVADPDDIHLRVNLSKIYRDSGQSEKAVRLFEDYTGKLSRAAWHEWAVAERWNNKQLSSIILAAISLCDLPGSTRPVRDSVSMSANTIAQNLLDLYKKYGDPVYLPTIVAAANIAAMFAGSPDDHGASVAQETLEAAKQAGAPDVPGSELVATIKAVIESVIQLVDFEALARERIPRSAVTNFEGLSAIVARQSTNRQDGAAVLERRTTTLYSPGTRPL